MKINRIKVVCIGEAMIELSTRNDGQSSVTFGGDVLNTAAYLAQLGDNQIESYLVTGIGTADSETDRFSKFLNHNGIRPDHVVAHPDRSLGVYSISVNDTGERSFEYWRSQSASRSLFDSIGLDMVDRLRGVDLAYFSGITLAILSERGRVNLIGLANELRRHGTLIAYDSNHRPKLWNSEEEARFWNHQALMACDLALPSDDDERLLYGLSKESEVVERLLTYAQISGVLKRGAAGPLSLEDLSTLNESCLGEPVLRPVDTTAAGDSFNAGFIWGYLQTKSLKEAMRLGHQTAKKVVNIQGAIGPLTQ